jgi:hypothetical protein
MGTSSMTLSATEQMIWESRGPEESSLAMERRLRQFTNGRMRGDGRIHKAYRPINRGVRRDEDGRLWTNSFEQSPRRPNPTCGRRDCQSQNELFHFQPISFNGSKLFLQNCEVFIESCRDNCSIFIDTISTYLG